MVSSVMKVHSDTCHCVMTETLTLSLLINEHLFCSGVMEEFMI